MTPDVAQASRLHGLGIDHSFRVLQVIENTRKQEVAMFRFHIPRIHSRAFATPSCRERSLSQAERGILGEGIE